MKKDEKLSIAVKLVNEAIRAEHQRLEGIAEAEESEPVLVEGETSAGFYCHMMVGPKDVAKIMLEYDYPVWSVLEEDAPGAMWEELGREFGLKTVCSVDL